MGAVKINSCRVCPCQKFSSILSLGKMGLTGHFPLPSDEVEELQIDLVRCEECGLVQLAHNYDLTTLYGQNYGYRSGLNQQMISHLKNIVDYCSSKVNLKPGDVVVDIGSNDGTSLSFYPERCRRVGIDPTASKFKQFYPAGTEIIEQFFPVSDEFQISNAKIVNSIACFYDLIDPIAFAQAVANILSSDGVWVLEMSYLPEMLKTRSYDTICHEHLEYYDLKQIRSILAQSNLFVYEYSFNSSNGGSLRVCAGKRMDQSCPSLDDFIANEQVELQRLLTEFPAVVNTHRDELISLLNSIHSAKKSVCIYGASTKGNVLLQYCGLGPRLIKKVAEVNPDKFGHVTPSTKIPIEDEVSVRAENPDYFLVLPWHFREGILKKEKTYLSKGGKFIFPLPKVEIVDKNGVVDL